ncbi:MAG: hypothetical protein Q4F31_09425 [Eubacteriales bacterium]|nr:hypothetical protein [Eubacteriales bacterium]
MASVNKHFKPLSCYQAILTLRNALLDAGIPFEFRMLYDGYQIFLTDGKHCLSVIEHSFSEDSANDLLEVAGVGIEDGVLGFLSPLEVFQHITKHFGGKTDAVE